MDCGTPLHNRPSTDRRVSSPRAANTVAGVFSVSNRLLRLFDMPRDVSDLLGPATVVHAEGLEPAIAWDLVETRFDDAQQSSRRDVLQCKLDERRRLAG